MSSDAATDAARRRIPIRPKRHSPPPLAIQPVQCTTGATRDPGSAEACASEHTAGRAHCHPDDGPAGWLASGEALSAVWLEAVSEGLGVQPISLPVEVTEVRDRLRRDVLGLIAQPQLLLQVGWPHTASARLAASPRRPLDDVIVA